MRIVVALGGNALLRRGEALTMRAQQVNARVAASAIAAIHTGNELVITHGNGPQVGLLALQAAALAPHQPIALDILGAESEGMIGYVLEQELRNALSTETPVATLLTMVEVEAHSSAFANPTKFVGPGYTEAEAERLRAAHHWTFRQDGADWRRVVASPPPMRVLQTEAVRTLMERGTIVITAGGGGIPVARGADGVWTGIEAVIDKDLCSALLARELEADFLLLATDVAAVYEDWGQPNARPIRAATPEALARRQFPAGSMGPKVEAACAFATLPGKVAAIGAIGDLAAIIRGEAGTIISRA